MSSKIEEPKPILPTQARWEPSADPTSIAVPGLDSTASVNDQIDQIEQLITIKLQNIDANFSKMQQIMSSRLLPAFKRYSVGTEPVREAAKFWTSFYEQAAQVRIPTYEDYSTTHDQSSHTEAEQSHETEADITASSDHSSASSSSHHPSGFDPSRLPSEESFLTGQAAVSSTPARTRLHHQNAHDTFTTQGSEPSWTASLESPMVRLDRDLQNFAREDQPISDSVMDDSSAFNDTMDATVHAHSHSHAQQANDTYSEPMTPSPDNGKSRQQQSLRFDVLRSTMESGGGGRSKGPVSPLKFRQKPKTPIPASRNPYLPPGTKPQDWSGVIDLRDPSITTPQRSTARTRTFRAATPPASAYRAAPVDDDEDDDFDLPPGMSPPVTMDIARLPTLGRTPRKEAAARIGRDLVGNAQRRQPAGLSTAWERARAGMAPAVESSMSSAPTPPSLSRYTRHAYPDSVSGSLADSTLESMIRRVGLMGYQQSSTSMASNSSAAAYASVQHPESTPSYYTSAQPAEPTPSYSHLHSHSQSHSQSHSYSHANSEAPTPSIQPLQPHIPPSSSLQTPEQPQARYDLYQLDDSQLPAGSGDGDEDDFSSDSLERRRGIRAQHRQPVRRVPARVAAAWRERRRRLLRQLHVQRLVRRRGHRHGRRPGSRACVRERCRGLVRRLV
ncbi:hypothetical protein EVG20_g7752 [Dentipellis fragilis]|uniref:DASH complex subunit ASK1 n=1 Tax=Dentipellis fragilis TaxID=205917 RepID=A0A4Y9YDC2_9AGAM|nr:hypothetical protein EVG20_g7752 [Dentipellis fragilis]